MIMESIQLSCFIAATRVAYLIINLRVELVSGRANCRKEVFQTEGKYGRVEVQQAPSLLRQAGNAHAAQ